MISKYFCYTGKICANILQWNIIIPWWDSNFSPIVIFLLLVLAGPMVKAKRLSMHLGMTMWWNPCCRKVNRNDVCNFHVLPMNIICLSFISAFILFYWLSTGDSSNWYVRPRVGNHFLEESRNYCQVDYLDKDMK